VHPEASNIDPEGFREAFCERSAKGSTKPLWLSATCKSLTPRRTGPCHERASGPVRSVEFGFPKGVGGTTGGSNQGWSRR
jgi:hypothetical protein